MNKETILVAIIALLVGGIAGYCLGGPSNNWRSDGGSERYGKYEDDRQGRGDGLGLGMMDGRGEGMMDHSMHMGMMVTSEKEFLTEMIPHHQEAVDTAKEVLARGATTPEIKALVEGIITAQEKEITDMKQWYQNWYGEAYQDKGTYTPMMRELATLSGQELDKAFLTDMIMHHMGAIMMARSVTPYVEHEEMKQLTGTIASSQSAEITQMRLLLQGL